MITIDLNQDYPSGRYPLSVKLPKRDREVVQQAAALAGMPTAAFVRTIALQVAQQVLELTPPIRGSEGTGD